MAENNDTSDSALPSVKVPTPSKAIDFVTILGLILSFGLIISAIAMGQSDAKFFNLPSVLIVLLGTMTATCTSYSALELSQSMRVIGGCAVRPVRNFKELSKSLLDIASIGRKKGVLFMSNYENQMKNEPFLNYTIGLAIDGYTQEDIERIIQQDIDTTYELGMRAASILKRASEVAPAMGLIGTLVGLVQMLADLTNPDSIGPAMAVALLTTFYGAIMGTVVMAPLSAKMEKNTHDEVMTKTLILKTTLSLVKQENPRSLEMIINSILPPTSRVQYFK